jgi:hypothetical protein
MSENLQELRVPHWLRELRSPSPSDQTPSAQGGSSPAAVVDSEFFKSFQGTDVVTRAHAAKLMTILNARLTRTGTTTSEQSKPTTQQIVDAFYQECPLADVRKQAEQNLIDVQVSFQTSQTGGQESCIPRLARQYLNR